MLYFFQRGIRTSSFMSYASARDQIFVAIRTFGGTARCAANKALFIMWNPILCQLASFSPKYYATTTLWFVCIWLEQRFLRDYAHYVRESYEPDSGSDCCLVKCAVLSSGFVLVVRLHPLRCKTSRTEEITISSLSLELLHAVRVKFNTVVFVETGSASRGACIQVRGKFSLRVNTSGGYIRYMRRTVNTRR